jgi:hypothetical protein
MKSELDVLKAQIARAPEKRATAGTPRRRRRVPERDIVHVGGSQAPDSGGPAQREK